MRILYHSTICPFSRKIRFMLAEKKLDFSLEEEQFWKKREDFIKLNPLCEVPVFIDLLGTVISDSLAIAEYLDEKYEDNALIAGNLETRAEIRRISYWFDGKFAKEVSLPIIYEKFFSRNIDRSSSPNSSKIREAKNSICEHFEYLAWLVDRRNWLAGNDFSLADITAAAHISSVDYFGDIPWDKHDSIKNWYARIKSRPTFRIILRDKLPGISPQKDYDNLDF